ncbi:metalloregulator ArsR/SmtB family transcription factor [Flavobacteriaceae bacterium 3-367]|uniref:ArsR/SmtB family transcription factor n=1 Tax=Eudoraea algarum TaxID=3417568 RepID=UPI003293C62A
MEKVFSALADGNRRKIIECLYEKDSTLLELTEKFPISFQAISKHIRILENAEIVLKEKKGKYRILSLNRKALRPTLKWISYYSNFWNESFDKLEEQIGNQN